MEQLIKEEFLSHIMSGKLVVICYCDRFTRNDKCLTGHDIRIN
ncbi:MAG: hypothetical protein V7L00_11235 [Nostoc sp.]